MGNRKGIKRFARRLKNTARRARKIIGGGARTITSLLGKADKLSGGAATRMLQSDPRTAMALKGVNMAADRPSQHR